jgi:hypothetical protein
MTEKASGGIFDLVGQLFFGPRRHRVGLIPFQQRFEGLVGGKPRVAQLASGPKRGLVSAISLAETFDTGRDIGTQVSKLYTGPFPFKGALDKVVIQLTD